MPMPIEPIRLETTPEDFARRGLDPKNIALWEDGRRSKPEAGTYEWWYFDAITDNGTKIAIVFHTKTQDHLNQAEDHPSVQIRITPPDGTENPAQIETTADQASFATAQCDVRIGNNVFAGDLHDYRIHVEPINGIGADLSLHSLGSPYRPGTGHFAIGNDERQFFTWFCVVPRGEVSGTITLNGETTAIHGYGYHDHQWLNINALTTWNHWLWARQSFDDHSMLLFDFVAGARYGYKRFPICFVQDGDGNLLFENTLGGGSELEQTYVDEVSGKTYPKVSAYHFAHDGTFLDYRITAETPLEVRDQYQIAPAPVQEQFDRMGLHPSYTRYEANGEMTLTPASGQGNAIERSGKLIYEFMFPEAEYHAGE